MKSKHKQMLETIEAEARYTASLTGRKTIDQRVMTAMAEVDREDFVPLEFKPYAFDNGPLPIGHSQTISQPYIVAIMTDLLELTAESTVLEIGTGSGYQAAVLSKLARQIYSIERIKELADAASERLKKLNYNNVEIRCRDGYLGWKEKAPFDAIIVTAAISHIPPELIKQLNPGGRLLIPVGRPHMHQELILLTKEQDETTHTESILGVAFVPFITDEKNDSDEKM